MRKGHGQRLSYYDIGSTPHFACQQDPRFSYCLYVPEGYSEEGGKAYRLIVLVHGTERGAWAYRGNFAQFAQEHDCIVLAPLFPANIGGSADLDNYKMIEYQSIRYDLILLSMVDEVRGKYRVQGDRFLLHGFSGGGQFAHRFLYLHPRRLHGVSIGAPGRVTLLDETRRWWVGVGDMHERFGIALDYEAMRGVPVLLVIGSEDTDTWEITMTEKSPAWMEGANDAGQTRQDRLATLQESLERAGISVRREVVPGAGHIGVEVLTPVKAFMKRLLEQPTS